MVLPPILKVGGKQDHNVQQDHNTRKKKLKRQTISFSSPTINAQYVHVCTYSDVLLTEIFFQTASIVQSWCNPCRPTAGREGENETVRVTVDHVRGFKGHHSTKRGYERVSITL